MIVNILLLLHQNHLIDVIELQLSHLLLDAHRPTVLYLGIWAAWFFLGLCWQSIEFVAIGKIQRLIHLRFLKRNLLTSLYYFVFLGIVRILRRKRVLGLRLSQEMLVVHEIIDLTILIQWVVLIGLNHFLFFFFNHVLTYNAFIELLTSNEDVATGLF